MATQAYHIPVMSEEVKQYLVCNSAGIYIDCTLGGGGHSLLLLKNYPNIRIIGIDCDNDAVNEAAQVLADFKDRAKILNTNFINIGVIVDSVAGEKVDGILVDLGVSSWQFDDKKKGFSFSSEVLDMRMDSRLEKQAADIINTYDYEKLTKIFHEYGEEPFASKIAKKIIEDRKKQPIKSGVRLAEIVETVKKRISGIHPATKVFQALRIAVNDELQNLAVFLDKLPSVLNKGGRVVIISYHSLEDRIVKNAFKNLAKENIIKLINKKVMVPSTDEVRLNFRSRSAKLRVAEKL